MKCLLCQSFSIAHICKTCQKTFLQPKITARKLPDGIEVISFYNYDEIKDLIHTKHTDLGYHIYKILSQNSFARFAKEFLAEEKTAVIGIDEKTNGLYSHTAILASSLRSDSLCYRPARLIAKNDITYSGKPKSFRLQNPRDFLFRDFQETASILVDDIITTGATLSEGVATLKSHHKEVLFCLTLADVKKAP